MSKYVVMATENCGCSEATFRDSFDCEFSGIEHETREEAMKELMEAKFNPDYVGYCFYIHVNE